MFVDHNLKTIIVPAGLLVLALSFASPSAIAQVSNKSCFLANETPVLEVDENTIICRSINPQSATGIRINDRLALYRYCKKKPRVTSDLSSITAIDFYDRGQKGVNIMQFAVCKPVKSFSQDSTAFSLSGRQFKAWSRTIKANPALLNRYRADVTKVLDAAEKYPVEKPTF